MVTSHKLVSVVGGSAGTQAGRRDLVNIFFSVPIPVCFFNLRGMYIVGGGGASLDSFLCSM